MNKAILVIDMPDRCWDCPVHASYAESSFSSREFVARRLFRISTTNTWITFAE